jgi:hypothetical protein
MKNLCTNENSCLYFFTGMGFRPAVHTVERDQYGDHMVLVVGDDSPLEGKVPAGYMMTELPVEPYGIMGEAMGGTSVVPMLTSGPVPASVPGIRFSGYGIPGEGTSYIPGDKGNPPDIPHNPDSPPFPSIPTQPGSPSQPGNPTPPVPGIEVPSISDLPPLAPVPLPGGGALMLSVAVVAVALRFLKSRGVELTPTG